MYVNVEVFVVVVLGLVAVTMSTYIALSCLIIRESHKKKSSITAMNERLDEMKLILQALQDQVQQQISPSTAEQNILTEERDNFDGTVASHGDTTSAGTDLRASTTSGTSVEVTQVRPVQEEDDYGYIIVETEKAEKETLQTAPNQAYRKIKSVQISEV